MLVDVVAAAESKIELASNDLALELVRLIPPIVLQLFNNTCLCSFAVFYDLLHTACTGRYTADERATANGADFIGRN